MNTLTKVNYVADHPLRGCVPDLMHWWMASVTRWAVLRTERRMLGEEVAWEEGSTLQQGLAIMNQSIAPLIGVSKVEAIKWRLHEGEVKQYPQYCITCLKCVGEIEYGGVVAECSKCYSTLDPDRAYAHRYDYPVITAHIGKLNPLRSTFENPAMKYLAHALTYEKYGQFEVPKGVTK